MFKKLLIFILTFVFFLTSVQWASAQQNNELENYECKSLDSSDCLYYKALYSNQNKESPWYFQELPEFQRKIYEGDQEAMFAERYVYASVRWIMLSLISQGVYTPGSIQALDNYKSSINDLISPYGNLKTEGPDVSKLGALAFLSHAISLPFANLPESGVQQTSKTIANVLNIVPSASAQGIGYTKLQTGGGGTITAIWTASRNASYLVIIVLLIAAGFMVMFRQQIAPNTVVTVQMMIPKLITTVLLVTFSYAIVGFVIDGIYVCIAIIMGLFSVTGFTGLGIGNIVNPSSLSANIQILSTAGSTYIGNTFLGWYLTTTWNIMQTIINTVMTQSAVNPLRFGPLNALFSVQMIIYGISLGVVVWSLWSNIKIVYTLFIAYLHLIILTIIGPLQIMLDIIPGKSSNGFVPWIKCVIGNASVFVLTGVFVIFMQTFFNFVTCNSSTSTCAASSFGINGIFSLAKPGFKVPFIGDTDQLAGDITLVGERSMGGALNVNIGGNIPSKPGWFCPDNNGDGVVNDGDYTADPSKCFDVIGTMTGMNIFSKVLNNTGSTFLLVGIISFCPTFITIGRKKLCGGVDINMDQAIEPLKSALGRITDIKPVPLF